MTYLGVALVFFCFDIQLLVRSVLRVYYRVMMGNSAFSKNWFATMTLIVMIYQMNFAVKVNTPYRYLWSNAYFSLAAFQVGVTCYLLSYVV